MPRTLSTQVECEIEDAADEIHEWANDVIDALYSKDGSYHKGFGFSSHWLNALMPLVQKFGKVAYSEQYDAVLPQTKGHEGLRALMLLAATQEYGAALMDYNKWFDEYNRLFFAENASGIDEVVSYRKAAFERCGAAWDILMPLWEAEARRLQEQQASNNNDTNERGATNPG